MLHALKEDIPYIENKYHRTDQPFNSFARMAYHGWACDPATGFDDAEMSAGLKEYVSGLADTEHAVIKAKAFAYVLDHMRFVIDEHDYFPCLYNWNRPINPYTINRWLGEVPYSEQSRNYLNEYSPTGDVTSWMDYDHSVPDWQALYELGFVGIKARAADYRAKAGELDAKQTAYFDSIEIEYAAILRLIARMRDYAAGLDFPKAPLIAECLDGLYCGAPRTLYERLMLIYLYFMLSESIDSYQVRSLGSGIDYDLYKPYLSDLESGRFDDETLIGFIGYFLMQFSAIGNYWGQPMYLGGRNFDGSSKVNELSYKILDIYDEMGIYNPKIQVKYGKNTPREFLAKICDMIRRGHSSFVFVCEDNALKTLLDRGIPYERCYDYDVKGCYEFALRAGEFSNGPFYVNLLGSATRCIIPFIMCRID